MSQTITGSKLISAWQNTLEIEIFGRPAHACFSQFCSESVDSLECNITDY